MLIGKPRDEAMKWLASLMNLNPGEPSTWPTEWMESLLSAANVEAERYIHHKVQQALNPHYRGNKI